MKAWLFADFVTARCGTRAQRNEPFFANLGGEPTLPWPQSLWAVNPAARPNSYRIPDLYARHPGENWIWTGETR